MENVKSKAYGGTSGNGIGWIVHECWVEWSPLFAMVDMDDLVQEYMIVRRDSVLGHMVIQVLR